MRNLGIQVYVSMLFCLCSAAFSCYMISKKCLDLQEQNEQLKESIKKLNWYLKMLQEHGHIDFVVLNQDETHIFDNKK